MAARRPYLETFLVSAAAILLEVSYTRVFSFKLVYYFSYLIIGIALLGLGAAGVAVATMPRLRRVATTRLLPMTCLLGAVAILVGYLVIARVQLNAFALVSTTYTHEGWTALREGSKLVVLCLALFAPFFAAGLALATIFSTHTDAINTLYGTDLVGAAAACALCVPIMVAIGPPGGVMASGLLLALAALPGALRTERALRGPVVVVAALLATATLFPNRLPDPITDRVKTMAPKPDGPVQPLFSRWSPVFRVDVAPSLRPNAHFLVHDGTVGSFIEQWDGDVKSLGRYDTYDRSYPFRLLGPEPKVAIIGAAGGNEILGSLYFGASRITGIELNPVTVSLHTRYFADFDGHLATNPKVTLVNAEGRSFLGRDRSTYDLIWFVAPDSYASMNAATSGAFVLSESYLYTSEMIHESLVHLDAGGLVCTQFGERKFEEKPNRTLRYLASARLAFEGLGITDFPKHVLVATAQGFGPGNVSSTILLRRQPFTEADVRRFEEATTKIPDAKVRWTWTQPDAASLLGQVITLDDAALQAWFDRYPFDVRPVTDDAPFFWHFVRFRDATLTSFDRAVANPEEGMGERLLLLFLALATVLAAVFLLTPLLALRATWRTIPHKLRTGIFFTALGMGFMFLEISLIQRLTLFLGYPTYSLSVTLLALLLSTGAGSVLSERASGNRNRLLLRLAGALVLLIGFYVLGMTPILRHGVGWPLALRIATAVLLLAPLGLCLGAFMPIGLRTAAALTPHSAEFVAWGWAVNGFASVVSSVLATVLSMAFGFDRVMIAAVIVYLVGIAALLPVPTPDG